MATGSTPAAPIPRNPKVAELVANAIRAQIVSGELREGDALESEAVLLDRYGVSRGTLREAMRMLEADSLISTTRGARVHTHPAHADSSAARSTNSTY
jgi:DNA-binding FadR family transcriptional regulator